MQVDMRVTRIKTQIRFWILKKYWCHEPIRSSKTRLSVTEKLNGTLTHITNATCAFYRACDANCAIRVLNLHFFKAQIHPTVHFGGNLALMISTASVWMNERGQHAGMRARTLGVLLCQHDAGEVPVSQQAVALSEGVAGLRTLANIRGDVLSDRKHIYEPVADVTCPWRQRIWTRRIVVFDADEELICRVMTDSVPDTRSRERQSKTPILWVRNIGDRSNERGGWWDTYSIGTDEHSSVRPFALVEAGVVDNSLSGQCKRLERQRQMCHSVCKMVNFVEVTSINKTCIHVCVKCKTIALNCINLFLF